MMWRDDYDGYGREGYGRGSRSGLGYGRGCGNGRGLGYANGYLTKEELKDAYTYRKKRLELELEELNKSIENLDKA